MTITKALGIMVLFGSLGFGQEASKQPPAPKVDPIQELKDQWKGLQAQTLQQEATIKDQALQLQNVHIQMREAKLQMKDIEAKLQSKLCDKGTMLNINTGSGTFTCIAEGKPK